MRILYVVQYYNRPDEPGGSRPYQFAHAWANAGHDVHLVTGGVNHKTGEKAPELRGRMSVRLQERGYTLQRVWSYSSYKGSLRKRYLSFFSFAFSAMLLAPRSPRPDLVLASSTPLTTGLAGAVVALLTGSPLVFEARDLWPKAALTAGVLRHGLLLRLAERLERWIYARSSQIVVVSRGDRQELISRGLPAARVHWIPNGVDDWMLTEEPVPLQRGDGPLEVVYAGAHGRWNHLHRLLDLAARVGPGIRFSLVGDGDEKPALEERARRQGLENVVFLGARSKTSTYSLIQQAHAAIIIAGSQPHFEQWLPNKVFDYLAAARPLIVVGRGEMARLVEEERCGGAAPPDDMDAATDLLMRFAALDGRQLADMGAAGRKLACGRFSRRLLAEQMLEVLRRAVAGDGDEGTDGRRGG